MRGVSLGLLVPAAMVSCSSSAYRLCNCYYFFLSLTLFFYSPLRDFSLPFCLLAAFTSSILHAYVQAYVHVHFFNSSRLCLRSRSILHVYIHVFNSPRLRSRVYVLVFNSSRLRSRLQVLIAGPKRSFESILVAHKTRKCSTS
jgi:hypothetical protein